MKAPYDNMTEDTQQTLRLYDNEECQNLFGPRDENLRLIRERCGTKVSARGDQITVTGPIKNVNTTITLFEDLLKLVRQGNRITTRDIDFLLDIPSGSEPEGHEEVFNPVTLQLRGKKGIIKPKTLGQRLYLNAIAKHDVVFGIGPAGTGKTYLAMAAAVAALERKEVRRIILARPAVEAGESLGYLPGDLQAKVDPFLRPLYDALYDMLPTDLVQRYITQAVVEIAPLAYMRGRTLNNSFIVLDEAQNSTREQMKMFLTRLGFNSKVIITGDITQIDLPRGKKSGLIEVCDLLKHIEDIGFIYLSKKDIVRHPLVQKIVDAYDTQQAEQEGDMEDSPLDTKWQGA